MVTGFKSVIPNYNHKEIMANLQRMLKGEELHERIVRNDYNIF